MLHTDDSPHAIALGTGVAVLVTFLPLVGLQTLIAVGLAALLRANKAVCIPIVWITNPLTMGPIYGSCYLLGRFVSASPDVEDPSAVLSKLQAPPPAGLLDPAFWKGAFWRLTELGTDLWIGCAIVAVVLGLASYVFARWGVITYRERRRQRLLRRSLLRSNIDPAKVVRRSESA